MKIAPLKEAFAPETPAERRAQLLTEIKTDLAEMQDLCGRLDMTTTCEAFASTLRVADTIFARTDGDDEFHKQLGHVEKVMQHELEARHFLWVRPGVREYYETNQFDVSAVLKLKGCEPDMCAAGECYALEQYPACVFHLMRVTDACLKRLIAQFRLPVDNRRGDWGTMLKAIRAERDRIKSLKRPDKDRLQYWQNVIDAAQGVKDSTRDPIAHSDEGYRVDSINRLGARYTQEEAARAFGNVRALARQVCALLP